ncbi:heavy-metal-associated domain-containing protein [Phycicoccus sp. MAQZ13P-2]|uniref:heavy-metal-associated domain-containing protein n=1 Tax=Phycicoccus mangrovi TaxID=2840470 RepID=UPI001C008C13|nr:heavy-metal-associated domain-containing protein [Phycicoccus mangrovi]MBT9257408.1 heavy-metal-associated domain-containing protein [Phycicoccus mangrovi]MBT9275717.1 heavy-metal-associated domain-containing protein [Phycicoccus mangrovi]
MSTTEFRVTGMTCGHCEMSVREEVSELPGVQVLEVDAASGRLVVGGDQVDEAQVLAAVEEAGYTAEPVR